MERRGEPWKWLWTLMCYSTAAPEGAAALATVPAALVASVMDLTVLAAHLADLAHTVLVASVMDLTVPAALVASAMGHTALAVHSGLTAHSADLAHMVHSGPMVLAAADSLVTAHTALAVRTAPAAHSGPMAHMVPDSTVVDFTGATPWCTIIASMAPDSTASCMRPVSITPVRCITITVVGACSGPSGDIAAITDRSSTSDVRATHSDHTVATSTAPTITAGGEATAGIIRAPGAVAGLAFSRWAVARKTSKSKPATPPNRVSAKSWPLDLS